MKIKMPKNMQKKGLFSLSNIWFLNFDLGAYMSPVFHTPPPPPPPSRLLFLLGNSHKVYGPNLFMNNHISILFQSCPVPDLYGTLPTHTINTSFKFQPICNLNLATYNPVALLIFAQIVTFVIIIKRNINKSAIITITTGMNTYPIINI